MSIHESDIIVSPQPDAKSWKLISPLTHTFKNGEVITIPAGFITDFASTPKLI